MFKKIALLATLALVLGVALISSASSANATDTASCVDGSNKSNLVYKWVNYDQVEITIKDGKTICKNVDLYFSAFVMPDTWNEMGFNETAVPQTLHRTVKVKLAAGTVNQKVTAKVAMPAECKNVQIDLYYGPEQTYITSTHKIGDRLVTGKYKVGIGECVVAPPVTPVTPVTPETPAPAELPKTGSSLTSLALAGLVATGVYAAVLRLRK